jgi:hypothetical protein
MLPVSPFKRRYRKSAGTRASLRRFRAAKTLTG